MTGCQCAVPREGGCLHLEQIVEAMLDYFCSFHLGQYEEPFSYIGFLTSQFYFPYFNTLHVSKKKEKKERQNIKILQNAVIHQKTEKQSKTCQLKDRVKHAKYIQVKTLQNEGECSCKYKKKASSNFHWEPTMSNFFCYGIINIIQLT